jgi:c(7)-type cytochrome triheme protein
MTPGQNTNGYSRAIVSFTAAVFVALLWWLSLGGDTFTNVVTASESPDRAEFEAPDPNQTVDYSKFRHGNQYHSRLPCLVCHVRNDNSSRISFPGRNNHLPCAGCHALQFADSSSPICTICHTNSQTGAMKAFPGLRSFGAKFNHSRHARVNCATCHTPAARGVARDIPSGRSAHTTCFQCHTANSSNAMASCSTCHQAGRLVRVSESARAFRMNFSHARHSAADLSCRSCHTVRAGSARGRQVSAPLASMHFAPAQTQSCATCHNGKRAFGADDFTNCKRCHQANKFSF